MSVVASDISPLNCRWLTWQNKQAICARPPFPHRPVSESVCSVCDFWEENRRQACPRCGSFEVTMLHHDEVVQSFSCAICHQHWLATRPWPMMESPARKVNGT